MNFHVLVILLLHLLLVCHDVVGFEATAADERVSLNGQAIYIDEENDHDLPLLKFNKIDGKLWFIVTSPNENLIQLSLSDDNILILHNTLDYDNPVSQKFLIQVTDEGYGNTFALYLKNINDNKPILKNVECEMEENKVINFDNTKCVYEITDRDGHLDTIAFNLEAPYNETFSLKFEEKPYWTVQQSTVSLILQKGKTLDYNEQSKYNFSVNLIDKWNEEDIGQIASRVLVVDVLDSPDAPSVY